MLALDGFATGFIHMCIFLHVTHEDAHNYFVAK